MPSAPIFGVISGDVIDSSRFEGSETAARFQERFRSGLEHVQSIYEDELYFDTVEIFQWDSFQTLVRSPSSSLRIALRMYLQLLKADPVIPCRISLGLGAVESPVEQKAGEAFRLSGRGLQEMKRGERLSLRCSPSMFSKSARLGWDSAVHLLSSIMSSWTPRQAEALAGWLEGKTQEEIARTMPPSEPDGPDDHVSQQYVSKVLGAARGRPVRRTLDNFEKIPF